MKRFCLFFLFSVPLLIGGQEFEGKELPEVKLLVHAEDSCSITIEAKVIDVMMRFLSTPPPPITEEMIEGHLGPLSKAGLLFEYEGKWYAHPVSQRCDIPRIVYEEIIDCRLTITLYPCSKLLNVESHEAIAVITKIEPLRRKEENFNHDRN